MIYSNFKDKNVSLLGLGCMRFPKIDGKEDQIDEAETAKIIDHAIKNGINYFDTAWGYHGGMSEPVMGKLLSKYPRDSYYLATKFPGYSRDNMAKVEEIFESQLERCKTDYFDFYLFHNVCETNIDGYMSPEFGIFDYLVKQKKAGRIRHLGFSAHGAMPVLKRFIEAYGHELEFCQIQLNYLDYSFQDANEKLEYLKECGLPVIVMEPVRGGRLAALSDEHTAKLKAIRPEWSTVEWAFKYLQSFPEVFVTLSGMSNMEQLSENIATYAEKKPLNENELATLYEIADEIIKGSGVPCTACQYCTSYCPNGLDIPALLKLYNQFNYTNGGFTPRLALKNYPEDKRPEACIGCRSCEEVCPQQIKISEALADFSEKLKKKD